MDTMEITKMVGAACAALLLFLLIGWGAENLYHVGGGGHGGEHANAYPIEVEDGKDDAAAEEGPSFAEILATADAAKGEKVFKKCQSCHNFESNGTGPNLAGIVGRDIGSVDGFGYSSILTELEGGWTPEALDGFLESPKGYAPGTKMSFAGLRKIADRANLVAYMASK